MSNQNSSKTDDKPKDPVLDGQADEAHQQPSIPSKDPKNIDLDLNQGKRNEKPNVDERVKQLDEVMDEVDLTGGPDQTAVFEALTSKDEKEHEKNVLLNELTK